MLSVHKLNVIKGPCVNSHTILSFTAYLSELLVVPAQTGLDEWVTEPEGGRGEGVGDGRVDGVVVVLEEAGRPEGQLEDLEDARAEDDGQPLVVGDVLQHRAHDLAGLEKDSEKGRRESLKGLHFETKNVYFA